MNSRFIHFLKAQNQLFGLADQLVVSVMSFAITLIVARTTNVSELGLYAICNSLIAIAITVQDSLITRPYSIQIFRPAGSASEHGYSVLVLSWGLSFLVLLVALLAALYFWGSGADLQPTMLSVALAVVAPFVLLREFGRRYSFANLKMYRAFALDAIAAVATLIPLAYLGWTKQLGATSAIMIMGAGAGAGAVLWYLRRRSSFAFSRTSLRQTLSQCWELGKWLLASQVAMQLQGYMIHWLCFLMIGAALTGAYAAVLSIVALANPFLFGFFNLLMPKSVRTLKDLGHRELRRQVLRDSLFLSGMMGLFTVGIYFGGERLMVLLYPGESFKAQIDIVPALLMVSSAGIVGAFSGPAAIALQSAEKGKAVARISLLTLAIGAAIAWALIPPFGLWGAALALLLTEIVGAVTRWSLLLRME
jgi:O-antigen/teichoic acid export membrane protein